MKLAASITRSPRPHDPEKGRQIAALVGAASPEVCELIAGAAGCSQYLATSLEREAAWLRDAVEDVAQAVSSEIATAKHHEPDEIHNALRQSKRRIALITALADLGGAWSLADVTGTLTDFADAACCSALRAGLLRQVQLGRLPGMREEDAATGAGMVVLAMGKMGAGELNYSSDIDLICLFDETRFDPVDFQQARSAFVRATRMMCAILSDITAQGYVFRTDLRLRPDPSVTPVCIAMEAAEHYYESLGRTWERAAYIKARPAAGDVEAGHRFLATLTPFVWRRHLDFAAIQDAHDMRLAIREHKGLGGSITLPGHNMKLGRGGIREIEFFTQTRQLISGGRDADLRVRGTVAGLNVLAGKGWIEAEVSQTLESHYVAHRMIEHRLQMVQDAQTHSLPRSENGFQRLADMMDVDRKDLENDLHRRLAEVHDMMEGFFAPSRPIAATDSDALDRDVLNRWVTYPALRTARSRQIFERVRPDLLEKLGQSARPQDALLAFDGFLSGLPAGVQLFSLLEANPQLLDLIIDITGTSPALAQYLSRNAAVFDAVIGGDFFSVWPGQDGLQSALAAILSHETDYERQLDAARRWHKEWHFRIGVHFLRGVVGAQEAGRQYADLARSIVAELWPVVTQQFSAKHGPPPGRGAVVLGMGSLGAGVLNAASDLDLIVIYDPMDESASTGKKPLATRPYYARLTQALITALSAPMSQGKLFDVDMRLRPSGNQGPVATSWASFQDYQRTQAWVWEHLALTRASVIAGPASLSRDVLDFQRHLIAQPRSPDQIASEVANMRARIRDAKSAGSLWETKIGAGRLQDIEMMAQAGALLTGTVTGKTGVGLDGASAAGLISAAEADTLKTSAKLFGDMHIAVRLLSASPLPETALAHGAEYLLLHTSQQDELDAMKSALATAYVACDQIITTALAPYNQNEDEDEG